MTAAIPTVADREVNAATSAGNHLNGASLDDAPLSDAHVNGNGEQLAAQSATVAAAQPPDAEASTNGQPPPGARVLDRRALVLNVTYQPLSITTVRRALLLMLSEKVDVLHNSDGLIRSESLVVDAPSVVRLRSRAPVPHFRRASLHRRAVFARDDHRCQYCGRPAECIDHVHPRSRGGEHSWENVVACCRQCNVAKGDKLLSQTRLRLPREPFAPDPIAVAALLRNTPPPEWLQYLNGLVPLGVAA